MSNLTTEEIIQISDVSRSKGAERSRGIIAPLTYIFIFLFLLSTVAAVYYYRQYSVLKVGTSQTSKEELDQLVEEIGALIELPKDEVPTLATVSDPNALSNQPFFTNAKTGDKVLIYSGARKAILYRPSDKKIIEVAPVSLDNTQTQNSPASSPGN